MSACPNCGRENSEDARFCSACGTSLAVAEPSRESRKVVTILFCDLVGSTALGESTDPEALRARMRRYFEDLRAILERHGGTVEKFVGDAVMAVFGIPVSHEDDALRAVRAAWEMRGAVEAHGLEARIGINTGEVVVGGQAETLVTGDAVNVAARLEQAARSGEIVIGAETRLLVRGAVTVEPVEALPLKGKSEPVEAYRLIEVLSDAAPLARHLETPLVGRERERQRLWRDYEDAVADRTCRLFTLLGPAGIGKSRLVADFLERVGDSPDVLRGRCLSYGEGITYWPLVEMLIAIGVDPDAVIGTSPPETQLAFRRLLEARAAERPQVVVIDDLQWAEAVFVDLVEHVADLSRDAPVFLLCVARTELLDVRPGWGGGKLNATSLLLEPLGADECEELMERLVTDAPLAAELRERITVASAGNPLFVEEMLAMVRERGGGEVVVPPTIQALLQARIDSLDGAVRMVMERGAVEGEVFHRGSVAELSPAAVRDGVESHLATLVRKELIRSTPPTFPEDEGFRFRHLLIRDAAYESLPKATRAELHEHFADWLSTHDLVEADEIVGYHLEQAHRYRAELDDEDPALTGLAQRASARLGAAGRSALDRGDYTAGLVLLRRAVAILEPDDAARHALAPDLAFALAETGNTSEAAAVLSGAVTADDPVIAAIAAVVSATLDFTMAGRMSADERRARREEARLVLEAAGHEEGLALYWWSVASEHWVGLQAAQTIAACERGLDHLARASAYGRTDELVWWIRSACTFGPMHVAEALERVDALERMAGDAILFQSGTDAARARLMAMQGHVDEARRLLRAARETHRAAGMTVAAAGMSMFAAWIEHRAGDLAEWERVLRDGLAELEGSDERAFSSTMTAYLAESLYEQGRLEEVAELCGVVREKSPPDDLINFVYVDALEACLLARAERHEEAQKLAMSTLQRVDTTDFFFARSELRLFVADVLVLGGRSSDARRLAEEALAILASKGDVTREARARERVAELGIEVA
ncbi:MAG TPA: adenylate/guanylate cyclase domain-containing protein [Gaiellaceae bacterium]|nr:adenylate/guanylate cyclase domain-containing protein [Gaiellaceae bacterium]